MEVAPLQGCKRRVACARACDNRLNTLVRQQFDRIVSKYQVYCGPVLDEIRVASNWFIAHAVVGPTSPKTVACCLVLGYGIHVESRY